MVELLVAVSIVMLLMVVTVPALTQARAAGRNAVCMVNQRQLGYITTNYCDDNSGYYPEFFFDFSPGNSNTIVILTVPKRAARAGWSYYTEEIRLCPEDDYPSTVPVLNPANGNITEEEISWGYNIDFLLHDIRDWELPSYGNPSGFAIFWDGVMGKSSAPNPGPGKKSIQGHYFGSFDFANRTFRLRHFNNRWGNVLYGDFHVEGRQFMTEEETLLAYQPVGLGNGNNGNGAGGNGGGNGNGNGGGNGNGRN